MSVLSTFSPDPKMGYYYSGFLRNRVGPFFFWTNKVVWFSFLVNLTRSDLCYRVVCPGWGFWANLLEGVHFFSTLVVFSFFLQGVTLFLHYLGGYTPLARGGMFSISFTLWVGVLLFYLPPQGDVLAYLPGGVLLLGEISVVDKLELFTLAVLEAAPGVPVPFLEGYLHHRGYSGVEYLRYTRLEELMTQAPGTADSCGTLYRYHCQPCPTLGQKFRRWVPVFVGVTVFVGLLVWTFRPFPPPSPPAEINEFGQTPAQVSQEVAEVMARLFGNPE